MGDGEDQYHKDKFIPVNDSASSPHAPSLRDVHEFDNEYESVINNGGRILKFGLVGVVALAVAGGAIYSCSSRDNSPFGSNNPSYIVPVNSTYSASSSSTNQ